MNWGLLWGGMVEAANRIMRRLWGDQTRDQSRLERDATDAHKDRQAALDHGDLDGANRAEREFARLHDEARAKDQ